MTCGAAVLRWTFFLIFRGIAESVTLRFMNFKSCALCGSLRTILVQWVWREIYLGRNALFSALLGEGEAYSQSWRISKLCFKQVWLWVSFLPVSNFLVSIRAERQVENMFSLYITAGNGTVGHYGRILVFLHGVRMTVKKPELSIGNS